MKFEVSTLDAVPFAEVHRCFETAFQDYAVEAAVMSEAALLRRARKNDWAPELSVGVWAGNELVGISLTGVDTVEGEKRGYDICTGVVPDHRGKGIAGLLIDEMTPRLRDAGVEAFQLEVLQGNRAGNSAYRKAGLTVTRGLVSYAETAGSLRGPASPFRVERVGLRELLALSPELDFEPSFEQRDAALAHLEDELLVLGTRADRRCVAAIAYDPKTAWIMRLVTHRDFRRRGSASGLLAALGRQLPADAVVKAVNIDVRDEAMCALMQACGLNESISQWEMRLDLGAQGR